VKEDKPVPEKIKDSPKKTDDAEKFLEELSKPSKGDELIEKLKKDEEENKKKEKSKNKDNEYASYINKDGVEVVDVKVISKDKDKDEEENKNDIGIPTKGKRNTWDKII